MAEKVVNSSLVLLIKFVASRQESASKAATSHIRKTLCVSIKILTSKKNMTKTIQILLFSILILTCNSANSQKKKNEIILKNGFTIVQDTISININGEMTHALKFKEKYPTINF